MPESEVSQPQWPAEYEKPTLEEIGAVWDLTQALAFLKPDVSAQLGPSPFPSDIQLKENLAPVDVDDVLDRVKTLRLHTWTYREEDDASRHIGPTAQDFATTFQVGDAAKISPIDSSGVSLAAVQSLAQKLEEQRAEIRALSTELESLRRELDQR